MVAVGACLKAARSRKLVKVIIDRRDAWAAIPEILGNISDRTYEKIMEQRQEDGGWAMTLQKMNPRKAAKRPVKPSSPPPRADVVVYRVRRSRRKVGAWDAKVKDGQERPAWISILGGTVDAGGIATAVAKLLEAHPGKVVAIAAIPEVVGLVIPRDIGDGKGERRDMPALVPLRLTQKVLLAGWTWKTEGGWLVGQPMAGKSSGTSDPGR